ncbi:MAG: metal ABC transporter ATP-binding protein [Bdellovibrionales bacterium]|nr:metal ABC transporter ATP-binding protein [Bdellovibrionales bacterium]
MAWRASFLVNYSKAQSHSPKSLADFPEHSADSPLSVHAMTIAYHQKPVLWDIEYEAPEKSLVAVVGPNGAGKTTFIKACLGLVPSASGRVEFWGENYAAARKRIAYLPQRESVDWDFPISALNVVVMGRYHLIGWLKRVSKRHKEAALEYLRIVGMADYADRQINQLSGGQQQRVFLARALAQEADLYFMDEPFAGVDAATQIAIFEVLTSLKNEGKTVICVHHDLVTVPDYFDHALLINTRVIGAGETKQVFTEENLKKTYGGRLVLLDEVANAIVKASRGTEK